MNFNILLIKHLQHSGLKIKSTIAKDSFNRVNAVLVNSAGRKYFMKAVCGKNSYEYKSLNAEADLTLYLNNVLKKKIIIVEKYKFAVPKVVKIIKEDDIIIFITEYINGIKYNLPDLPKRLDIISAAIKMVSKIDYINPKEIKRLKLKIYSKSNLLVLSFFRFLKSITNSKISIIKLFKVYLKTFKFIFTNNLRYSLIHPDLNITNFIIKGRTLFITDWEESGWGISLYNTATPVLLYGYDKNNFDYSRKILAKNVKFNTLMPLLAYKVLVLFNQKTDTNSPRYKRDYAIISNF